MGIRDSGADERTLPFTSRLRRNCRKKKQAQERERFIQGHRLHFGEESSYEKSSGNPPPKWKKSTGSVTAHQMPWREGKGRYPIPARSWQFTPWSLEHRVFEMCLMLTGCCFQPAALELESLRLVPCPGWGSISLSLSSLSPLCLFTWLTATSLWGPCAGPATR